MLQDWRTNRTERESRQRAIAEAAQLKLDEMHNAAHNWQVNTTSGPTGIPNLDLSRQYSEAYAYARQELERLASRLNDAEIPALVKRYTDAMDARGQNRGPIDPIYTLHPELRVRLGKYFH